MGRYLRIRKHWGIEPGQTVAVPKNLETFIYIRGYDSHGDKGRLYIAEEDITGLVLALLDVQRRKG